MGSYTVHVVRKDDRWYARLPGGVRFEAGSEEKLRESVRAHLLKDVIVREGGCEDDYDTKMGRTWRVRITRAADRPKVDDEEFTTFDLFG